MQDTAEQKPDVSAYQIQNAEALTRNMMRVFEQSGKVMSDLIERSASNGGPMSASGDAAATSHHDAGPAGATPAPFPLIDAPGPRIY